MRLDYWPEAARDAGEVLADPSRAYVSRYALGRDYHKVLRARLQALADRIVGASSAPFGYRVFTDSAPVMEVALAARAGLGWRGKHTLLLTRDAGSLFFLGELFVDLPLPATRRSPATAAPAQRCLDACPTRRDRRALPARRAPLHLLPHHRAPGADPRGAARRRSATASTAATTASSPARGTATRATAGAAGLRDVRNGLDDATLVDLFAWTREEFDARLEGSAIRRIGHARWLRNIAVALGNAPPSPAVVAALRAREHLDEPLVREHVAWALHRHRGARGESVREPRDPG